MCACGLGVLAWCLVRQFWIEISLRLGLLVLWLSIPSYMPLPQLRVVFHGWGFVVAVQSPYHSCDLDCKIYIYI